MSRKKKKDIRYHLLRTGQKKKFPNPEEGQTYHVFIATFPRLGKYGADDSANIAKRIADYQQEQLEKAAFFPFVLFPCKENSCIGAITLDPVPPYILEEIKQSNGICVFNDTNLIEDADDYKTAMRHHLRQSNFEAWTNLF